MYSVDVVMLEVAHSNGENSCRSKGLVATNTIDSYRWIWLRVVWEKRLVFILWEANLEDRLLSMF